MLALYTYEETTSTDNRASRPATTTTRSAWSTYPSAPPRSPNSSATASPASARWRASRTPSANPGSESKLESEALDERYEIFSLKGQDQVWLRRLFSPTFVVWLGEEAPKKFAFELVTGTLCCYVNGHKKSAAELDAVRDAAVTVARRLREESAQSS